MGSSNRDIHVLGIESSCDDTGVAIVNQRGKILSNCINSQLKQHLQLGGIIPSVASEYHVNNIDEVARRAFQESGLRSIKDDIDAIAVSTRPGLSQSLQVGLNYARQLAKKWSKPLMPIHHMQAHALMPLLQHPTIKFPFLALLISGGHCILALVERYNKFNVLGESIDDAPGDLLDKFGRRFKLKNLGPPYDSISGGAAVELLSRQAGADRFKYFNSFQSVPMLQHANCDFSFTGYRKSFDLAEQVLDGLWRGSKREQLMANLGDICASLQRIILIQLVKKLERAYMYYRMHWRYQNAEAFACQDRSSHLGFALRILNAEESNSEHDSGTIDVVVSGGCAANSYLVNGIRTACKDIFDSEMETFWPSKDLCSDNGLMIAWNGMLRYRDYLEMRTSFDTNNTQNSILFDPQLMDSIEVKARDLMGLNLRDKVKNTPFKLRRFQHPELNLRLNN